MNRDLLAWDIYEITTETTKIHGIMLRGRLRKLGLERGFNILCENATDKENCVRFAVLHGESIKVIADYVSRNIADAVVWSAMENTSNPVLSKLQVNSGDRYKL